MAAAGKPFNTVVVSKNPAETALDNAVAVGQDDFSRLGYGVVSRDRTSFVLERRFVPRLAYLLPLAAAVIAFAFGVGGTLEPALGGQIAAGLLALTAVLGATVKIKEQLTVKTEEAPEGGARVYVAGVATPAMAYFWSHLNEDGGDVASQDA